MNRYLLWSIIFHCAVVLGGAGLAPMRGGFTNGAEHSSVIISVGLVDMPNAPLAKIAPMPTLAPPPAAADADIALKPVQDLAKEDVKDKPSPDPKPEKPKKPKDDKDKNGDDKKAEGTNESPSKLASADTATATVGTISEGGGGGDVWGVETNPNVNPYHKRGFATIRTNWRNPAVGPSPLKCTVKFRVLRSGEIVDIETETPSRNPLFDRSALRAVRRTATWDQFPKFWTEDEQIIYLDFEYRP